VNRTWRLPRGNLCWDWGVVPEGKETSLDAPSAFWGDLSCVQDLGSPGGVGVCCAPVDGGGVGCPDASGRSGARWDRRDGAGPGGEARAPGAAGGRGGGRRRGGRGLGPGVARATVGETCLRPDGACPALPPLGATAATGVGFGSGWRGRAGRGRRGRRRGTGRWVESPRFGTARAGSSRRNTIRIARPVGGVGGEGWGGDGVGEGAAGRGLPAAAEVHGGGQREGAAHVRAAVCLEELLDALHPEVRLAEPVPRRGRGPSPGGPGAADGVEEEEEENCISGIEQSGGGRACGSGECVRVKGSFVCHQCINAHPRSRVRQFMVVATHGCRMDLGIGAPRPRLDGPTGPSIGWLRGSEPGIR